MKKINKNLKKLSVFSLTALSAVGTLSLTSISNVSNNQSIALSNAQINNRTLSSDVNYDAVFSSIKSPGQSSSGGVFGYDNNHSISLTTYNNILAWKKDVTEHRALKAALDSGELNFDISKAKVTSFKNVSKKWGNSTKEILYVSLSTFTGNTIPSGDQIQITPINQSIILPYDAVSGEDIITVTEPDGTIDWKKNLINCKNDIVTYNGTLDRFYVYRYGKVRDLMTTKTESFVHYYGKGFQRLENTQEGWTTNLSQNGSSNTSVLYAIIETNSQYNTLIYYDVGSGKLYANSADRNLNVKNRQRPNNQFLFAPNGVNGETNDYPSPADRGLPLLSLYGFNLNSNDSNFSYSLYLMAGRENCIMIYKTDHSNGTITRQTQFSLQENQGGEANGVGFDVLYYTYSPGDNTVYLSSNWSTGTNYDGRAIASAKIDNSSYAVSVQQVTNSEEGRDQGKPKENNMGFAVAPYKGKDGTYGVVTSRSPKSQSSAPITNTDLFSFIKSGSSSFERLKNGTRNYFDDFQSRADQIWKNNGNMNERKWASEITPEMIIKNAGTGDNQNIIKINPQNPATTTFKAENVTSNDEKGILEFELVITAEKSGSTSPATKSKVFVQLEGFRTIGDATFVEVAEAITSTDSVVSEKRNQLNSLYNQLPSTITEEIINTSFTEKNGKKTSAFWNSPEGSYYNDFYAKSLQDQNDKVEIKERDDNSGRLVFEIDFTDVTPKSVLDTLTGNRNVKRFEFTNFSNLDANIIRVNKNKVEELKTKMFGQIEPLDVVSRFIIPHDFANKDGSSGKAIQTGNLVPVDGSNEWLKDQVTGAYRWWLEKLPVGSDQLQINSENPVPSFNLYYYSGTEKTEDGAKNDDKSIVKVLWFKDGRLTYNRNTINAKGKNPDPSNFEELASPSIATIYSKYFNTNTSSPISKQSLSDKESKVITEILGTTDNAWAFGNYNIANDISPSQLWENMKNGETDFGKSINFNSYFELNNVNIDGTSIDIKFIDKDQPIPEMPKGGIVVRCNNSDRLGTPADIIKPIPGKNGVNGYFNGDVQHDTFLDLSFKIVDNTETTLTNAELGDANTPGNYKITSEFTNKVARTNLQWGWDSGLTTRIVKTEVENFNPYFNYSLSKLSSTIETIFPTSNISTTNNKSGLNAPAADPTDKVTKMIGTGIHEITLDDIMNAGDKALQEGLSKDKTLDEMNPAIFNTDFTLNPLIVADNLPEVVIDVVKDNVNGVATLLISVPKTESSSKSFSVEVEQTINISGFKKPTNWFLVAGIPSIVISLIIIAIVAILIVKKVSNKNLKKFIDNQLG